MVEMGLIRMPDTKVEMQVTYGPWGQWSERDWSQATKQPDGMDVPRYRKRVLYLYGDAGTTILEERQTEYNRVVLPVSKLSRAQ